MLDDIPARCVHGVDTWTQCERCEPACDTQHYGRYSVYYVSLARLPAPASCASSSRLTRCTVAMCGGHCVTRMQPGS